MPDFIPLTPSDTNYELRLSLDNEVFLFGVRWNSRDEAFYLDIKKSDGTPVLLGIKLVLGVPLGRTRNRPFFVNHFLKMVDTSGEKRDATFDDIGSRVFLMHLTRSELINAEEDAAPNL